jgi:hypothetical protein
MSQQADTKRPVKLQVNTTGAWRNVLDFDVNDGGPVMSAAAGLFSLVPQATLRIIIPGEVAPLMYWAREKGWVEKKGWGE